MRRLATGQRVTIDLEGEPQVVDAVTAFDGDGRILAHVRRASPHAIALLVTGSLGYLLFTHKGALIGLRGVARISTATRPMVEFVFVDDARQSERRAADRVAIGTRATVGAVSGDRPVEPLPTFTVNLSATGALLKRPPDAPESGEVALELFFGSDPAAVTARGHVVRATDEHLAVQFDEIEMAQELRLIRFLAGHERRHRIAT